MEWLSLAAGSCVKSALTYIWIVRLWNGFTSLVTLRLTWLEKELISATLRPLEEHLIPTLESWKPQENTRCILVSKGESLKCNELMKGRNLFSRVGEILQFQKHRFLQGVHCCASQIGIFPWLSKILETVYKSVSMSLRFFVDQHYWWFQICRQFKKQRICQVCIIDLKISLFSEILEMSESSEFLIFLDFAEKSMILMVSKM